MAGPHPLIWQALTPLVGIASALGKAHTAAKRAAAVGPAAPALPAPGKAAAAGKEKAAASPPPPPSAGLVKTALVDSIPLMLKITFIVQPMVTNKAFIAFNSEGFDDGTAFMVEDFSIATSSPDRLSSARLLRHATRLLCVAAVTSLRFTTSRT